MRAGYDVDCTDHAGLLAIMAPRHDDLYYDVTDHTLQGYGYYCGGTYTVAHVCTCTSYSMDSVSKCGIWFSVSV